MRRTFSTSAEIVGRGHQSYSEMTCPNPIDHHSRRERVLGVGNPTCQCQPATAGIGRESLPSENRKESTGYGEPSRVGIAAVLNLGIVRYTLPDSIGMWCCLADNAISFDPRCRTHDPTQCTRRLVHGCDWNHWNHIVWYLVLLATGVGVARALEDAVEGVIVLGAHGVIFVIVTTGTADCHTQEALAKSVDRILDSEEVIRHHIETKAASNREIAGSSDKFRIMFAVGPRWELCGKNVAGQLLRDKPIVRLIGIEGIDDVVAISPGIRNRIVRRFTSGIGIANHIEPISSPFLAIPQRCQQMVHYFFEGIRCDVFEKSLDLVGCGWQPR